MRRLQIPEKIIYLSHRLEAIIKSKLWNIQIKTVALIDCSLILVPGENGNDSRQYYFVNVKANGQKDENGIMNEPSETKHRYFIISN